MKDTFFGRLDYLIFDTPPGTSDEHLTVVKLLKSVNPDGAVIVTTPQSVALDTIKKELAFCSKTSLPVLGIVENMGSYACPCCQEKWDLFPNSGVKEFAVEHDIPYLGKIPVDPNLSHCCEDGSRIEAEYLKSPGSQSVRRIAEQLTNKLSQDKAS